MPRGPRRMKRATCANCGADYMVRADRRRPKFCTVKCAGQANSGAQSVRYHGGLCFSRYHGRWVIVCRDGSLMYYARGVMAAEVGRLLGSDELVHHVNGNPSDDRPENLALTTRAEHIDMHRADLMAGRR